MTATAETLTDRDYAVIYDALMSEGCTDLARKVRRIRTEARTEATEATETPKPAAPADAQARIRQAYAALAPRRGAWLKITDVRQAVADLPARTLDVALHALSLAEDVEMMPESNQKTLTAEDRRNAVRVGGRDAHLMAIGIR